MKTNFSLFESSRFTQVLLYFLNIYCIAGGLSSEAVPESEISTILCEYLDTTDPLCEEDIDNCRQPITCEGSPKAYCFATWRNGSHGFENVMKGCWSSGDNCVNNTDCIQSPGIRNLNFCCCQEPLCNTVVKSVEYVDTTLEPKTTGRKNVRPSVFHDSNHTTITIDFYKLLSMLHVKECSGSVVECFARDRRPRVRASPSSLCCVLEQDTLILTLIFAQYWFNPGRPIPI